MDQSKAIQKLAASIRKLTRVHSIKGKGTRATAGTKIVTGTGSSILKEGGAESIALNQTKSVVTKVIIEFGKIPNSGAGGFRDGWWFQKVLKLGWKLLYQGVSRPDFNLTTRTGLEGDERVRDI